MKSTTFDLLITMIIIACMGLLVYAYNRPEPEASSGIIKSVYYNDNTESIFLYAIDSSGNVVCNDKDLAIKVLHDELTKQYDSTRKWQFYLEAIITNKDTGLTPRELLGRIIIHK